jgi:hypothetical protein
MSRHSFDPEVAAKVGLNAAVIFQNIVWWAEKNAANNKHFHDGLWWTYNSVSAFADLFPYLTGKQIRTALTKLEDDGFLVSGSFNKSAYDRTKWYAPTCPIGKSDLPKRSNENDQEGEPIPDINTDDKLNKNIRAHEMPNYWRPTNFDPHTKTAHIIAEWTPEEYLTTLEHFEQHHRSKGSKFKDWQSAWGTWVLNSAKYKGKTNGKANRTANSNGSPRDGFAAVLREVGSREDAFPTFDDDGGMRQASPTRLIAPR